MNVSFQTILAYWLMCFGTFVIILIISWVLGEWIVQPNSEDLKKRLEIKFDDSFINIMDKPRKAYVDTVLMELSSRGNCSLEIVAKFTKYHYSAIISTLTSAAFGGIATFMVSSFSWAGANAALQGFFVGSAVSLTFWLAVVQVFKYHEIIAKHELIYSTCCSFSSEIKRVMLWPPKLNEKDKPFCATEYISDLAKKLETVRAIGISFDGTKIGIMKVDLPR